MFGSVKIVLLSVDDNEKLIRINLYFFISYFIDRPSTMPVVLNLKHNLYKY
jgi:hypothetical protein